MMIPVGPFCYQVKLVSEPLFDGEGHEADGLCRPFAMTIQVSAALPPDKRLATLWHEIGHAWKAELDVRDKPTMDEESLCRMIGLAMAGMPPRLLAALHLYMMRGYECSAAIMLPAGDPIPILPLDH